MSPGLLSDRRAIVALIIAIPLALIAYFVVKPIDYNLSLMVFGVALVFFVIACVLDTADEFVSEPEREPIPAPEDKHVEEYTPEVEAPAARLTKLPIETIEGIGAVYGKELRKVGYETVADLITANPDKVAETCDVNKDQAERWIAMARFAWLDSVSEEDAEAIVFATGITDLEGLAAANPDDLLVKIESALAEGEVRVPAGYKFDVERIRQWIEEAKTFV
ncbi:MAG: hypothetical protein DRO87_11225 [Candidatus Thorarchaeota archaeon]|nr:MAG: hypothetical protein DRO87_11225 [Candidatus Thorarchaeota archaeon]RLI58184.1 MAG: hypothetical protein DRP09_00145 [Candidatus Thorarchaeota archaeon]